MNFSLLKNKNFSLLILSNFISITGTEALEFALSLYILTITGSAVKFAFLLSISAIPPIILGPISGVFVDWLNRKKLLILLNFSSTIILAIFTIYFINYKPISINKIYVLSVLLSIVAAIFNPAISTITPSIIEKDLLVDANGFNNIIKSTAAIIAPMIAGVLFSMWGLSIILIIDLLSFGIAAISSVFITIPRIDKSKNFSISNFFEDFKEGLKFIKSKNTLFIIIILGLITNFAYCPIVSIGFNYLAKIILHVTDYQLGILNSISIVSVLISPFLCKLLMKKINLQKIILFDISIVSILLLILALLNSGIVLSLFNSNTIPYINLIIIGFLLNLVSSTVGLALTTVIQSVTPIDLLGRVFSVFSTILLVALPIGQVVFGILLSKYPVYIGISISGIIILATALLSAKYLLNSD